MGRSTNVNMKLQPLHDRIVVEPAAFEEKSAGGIILPDTAKEKPMRGKVVATGPGKTLDNGKKAPVDVKVGDTVLYGKYSGTEVTVSGTDYVILRNDDVLGIVTGTAAKSEKKVAVGARK
jgi:chaperonin GroES